MCKLSPNLHAQKVDFARAEGIFPGEFARAEILSLHDLDRKFTRAPTSKVVDLFLADALTPQTFTMMGAKRTGISSPCATVISDFMGSVPIP